MTAKRRMRDFQRCLRTIQSFSDNQASVTEWDEDCLDWLTVQLRPKDGYYSGGLYEFKIIFESFPTSPPRVDCLTKVYHPNIDSTSGDYNVCLNLFDEWSVEYSLEDVVQGLLFLMYNPNTEDPLSPYFDPSVSEEEFKESLDKTLKGEEIEGVPDNEFTENQSVEQFDKSVVNHLLEAILESTDKMNIKDDDEDNEKIVDKSEDDIIDEEAIENARNSEASDPTDAQIIQDMTKLERLDSVPSSDSCTEQSWPNRCMMSVSRYIPRTFTPPQPDYLVSLASFVYMASVQILERR